MAEEVDPSADGRLQRWRRASCRPGSTTTSLTPAVRPAPRIFTAARGGDPLARTIVEEVARRIAAHITPIAAVADPALVVLGGGLGTNGDLLLTPVRRLLAAWIPYAPRVEISTLGESAVLMGALAVGLRSALDNVLRQPAARRHRVRATPPTSRAKGPAFVCPRGRYRSPAGRDEGGCRGSRAPPLPPHRVVLQHQSPLASILPACENDAGAFSAGNA